MSKGAKESLQLGSSARKLDAVAVRQGIERECPYREGVTFTILPAAHFNPRFRRAVQNRMTLAVAKKANGLASEDGAHDETFVEEAEGRYDDPEFIASALLADINGIRNEKGNPVKYTHERGVQILSDPSNWDVREWLINEALTLGQFYTDDVEAAAKN